MNIKKPLAKFNNGNNKIIIYDDGTQIINGDMNFEFPLTIDCKISSLCTMNCPYCYEGNNENGKIADFNQEWIDSLHPYTEIAINLNDPIDNENLVVYNYLNKLKKNNIITNVTVNIKTFRIYKEILLKWQQKGLFYGIGISLTDEFNNDPEFYVGEFKKFNNLVIHTIFGITTYKQYKLLSKYYLDAKVLILGYKDLGRGINYKQDNNDLVKIIQKEVEDNFIKLKKMFNTLAFDCLAVEQLDIKNKVSKEDFDKYYLGDDGTRSIYIDMVNKKFAKSSTSLIRYKLLDNIKDMFDVIKSEV